MDTQPQSNQQNNFVTIDDLASQLFPPSVGGDLSQIQVHEAKAWPMRQIVLGAAAGWIFIGTAASAILFFLTKSQLAFLPLTATLATTAPLIIRDTSRFLFWRPEDYKLEALKLTLKARRWELKYLARHRPTT